MNPISASEAAGGDICKHCQKSAAGAKHIKWDETQKQADQPSRPVQARQGKATLGFCHVMTHMTTAVPIA